MKKRLLSLLLILSMLVSMIPAYALPEGTGTNYVYNLARLQYGQWSSEGVNPSTITDWNSIDALGNYFDRTTDPFKFYAQSSKIDWRWTGSSHNKVGPTIDGGVGEWGGIVIRVGESALYDVSMRIIDDASAANLDFYLAPASATNPQNAEYYLGSTAYSGEARALKMVSFGEQYLDAGDYIVVFKMKSKGTTYAALSNVTLTWVSDEKPIEAPKNYVYNLARLQYGQWSDSGVAPNTLTDWDSIDKLDNFFNRTTDPFKFYGESSAGIWTWTKSSFNEVGPTIYGGVGSWGGIVIRVGESALYDVSMRLLDSVNGSSMDFYLAPLNAANPQAAEYYIGSTDYTETTATLKVNSFGEKYLEKGDYVVSFKITKKGSVYTAISNVGLTWKSYEKPVEPPRDYIYNLGRLQYGQWSSEGVAPNTLTDWDALGKLGNYYNRKTDPFMFYGQSAGMSWTWTPSSMGNAEFGPRGPSIHCGAGEWGGINIRLAQTALYDFNVRFADYKGMPSLKIYLAPFGAENPMDAKYYMGTAVPKSENAFSVTTENFGRRYLPEGDYTVIIENVTGKTEFAGGIAEIQLGFVSLEPSERLVLSGEVDTLLKDETVPLSLSATWDGEEIALEDLDILRVELLNREVATLTETDGAYSVFGVWKGETAIRVSAEYEGEVTAIDIPITVALPEGYLELDVTTEGVFYCKTNETVSIPMTYWVNRETASASDVTVTAEVEDPTVADVSVEADGKVKLFGKFGGKTTLTVTVAKDGKSESREFEVEIDPIKYFYSLHNGYQGPWSDSVRPITYFVDYDMFDKNPEGELPTYWTAETEPWKFIDKSSGFSVTNDKSFRSIGYIFKGSTDDYINFGIKVRKGGTYNFATRVTGQVGGGLMDIYVSPLGTPKEEWNNDRYYVGRISGEAPVTTYGIIDPAGNVTLEEGEYNVYCSMPAVSSGTNGIWFVGFCLNDISENQFRVSGSSVAPIMESASGEIPLLAFYNGAEIGFDRVTEMSVTSADERIATATAEIDGTRGYLNVNGITPGETTVTVQAVCDGIVSTKTIKVEIARKDQIQSITLNAEKQKLDAGDRVQTTVSATRYDGAPASLEGLPLYYESSNPKAVSVDGNGVITALEKGESIVRAWTESEGRLFSGEILVTVDTYSPIKDVVFGFGNQIKVDDSKPVETSVILESGMELPSNLYTATVTLEHAEPADCVTLENGVLSASAPGTFSLHVAIDCGGEIVEFTKKLSAIAKPDLNARPEALLLKAGKKTLSVGERTTLDAGVYYTDGSLLPFDADTMTLTYDDTVLSYENGIITALSSGDSLITFDTEGLSKNLLLTVDEEVLGSVEASLDGTLYPNKTASVQVSAYTDVTARAIANEDLSITYAIENEEIASVDESGVVTGIADGDTTLTVTVTLAETSVNAIVPITVYADTADSIQLTVDSSVMKPDDTDGIQMKVSLVRASGEITELAVSDLTFVCSDPELLTITEEGVALPKGKIGSATVTATFHYEGRELSSEIELTVKEGKTESTIYTKEKLAAAKKNVENYDWARTSANTFDNQVEYLVGQEEWVTELVTSQELPRNWWAAYQYDPNYQVCRYCGTNMTADSGDTYPYKIDIVNYPWKIQCPTCLRRFPSNDFGEFYKTGLDEHGFWSYEKAKANGSHLLVNTMYPEKDEHIDKNGVLQNEGVHGWGVDDGYGYKTGKKYDTAYGEWDETWTFIAYYNAWGIWNGFIYGGIPQMVRRLTLGYTYSGGEKKEYGRVLAVLLDRIADIYPEMSTGVYDPYMLDNGWYGGKFAGGISDTDLVAEMAAAYDAVFDLYDDPVVMANIRKNAEKWNFDNKNTPAEVREHFETNFLHETIKALDSKQIYGNDGMHQTTMVYTGVVLDKMPESKTLIDTALTVGSGGILNTMASTVNRDGHGTENSIMYNGGWISEYATIADILGNYKSYPAVNLYQHPKFVKMLKMNLPLTMARRATLNIGDCYGLGDTQLALQGVNLARALMAGCEDPEIAQNLYFVNGNSYNGPANRDIFLDPDAVAAKLKTMIEKYGEYDFDQSTQMTGFGVGVLRGGTFREDNRKSINTQRAVAMWYGETNGHGHSNALDLSMYAYGINVMPAFGYPTNTSGIGSTQNWERATISHNTVQVNGVQQDRSWNQTNGDPLHFDDSGRVKLIDARKEDAYPLDGVSEYRRTAIMVEVNDEDAYTVDLFRVIGGNEHLYSFHSQSNTVTDYTGLSPVYQKMGTYAGPNVPFGPGNLASGYDSFYDVYRTVRPENKYSLTFKVEDFRNVLSEGRDLYLRVTQLNDFTLDDVSFASAVPPNTHDNTREIKYLLARRNGKDLDSLFTTVIEPYDKTPLIDDVTAVTVTDRAGNEVKKDVRALKVTLKNGRVDYIVYAADNTVRYRIDDKFDFIGFVGVISYRDDVAIYRYLHDGTMLDGMYGEDAVTGNVLELPVGFQFNNWIRVSVDRNVDVSELAGKTIYIDNYTGANLDNGAYAIKGAVKNPDGTVTLDIGDITTVKSQSGNSYTYNTPIGRKYVIPLTTIDDDSPIVEPIKNQVAMVGDTLNVPIKATSPSGKELTYTLTRSINGATMQGNVFCFTPSAS
ncbi:MAG: Ig-like domain-containing protein, partial [Oscillospiraceae bacterium]|nr:Ig-like domain-containing protein [Oscillospiraceae bacterium]